MHAKAFVALLLPVLAVYANPVKRDTATVTDANGLVSVIQSVVAAPTGGSPLTLDVAIPVTLTPGQAPNAIASALAEGMASFVLAAENKLLPSGVTIITTTVSGTPVAEVSSIGGSAITLANPGEQGVATSFAGATFTVPATNNNAALGLKIPVPLLTGLLGALGVIAGGAMMIL